MNKTKISFSVIGAGHAPEQENQKVKELWRIKGIGKNQEEYFFIASGKNATLDEFCCTFLLNFDDTKRQENYSWLVLQIQELKDVEMLTEVFVNHKTNFEDTPSVHNIITKTVIPHADAKEFSNQAVEGEKLHDASRIERLEGDKSIWIQWQNEDL